ncbi:MAG: outer membrane lipid asymmetry maintenance protein MlaD [Deltaproteobacteria bacterium]|nr:MAG: outer membrane lipid asymmetry maintenance protein MlaD [Deltaproteobacteria bacterium]
MVRSNSRDFVVGLFVLVGLAALAYLSFTIGGASWGRRGGVKLHAVFDQIADLKVRAPVSIAGVSVGEVTGISLQDDYRARVELEIDPRVHLPIDSSAAIVTSGLLGDRYIAIEPGAEDRYLGPGEEIVYTESALVLERVVGKFLYNFNTEQQ